MKRAQQQPIADLDEARGMVERLRDALSLILETLDTEQLVQQRDRLVQEIASLTHEAAQRREDLQEIKDAIQTARSGGFKDLAATRRR